VWGHLGAISTRTVDAHIAELRRKIEDDPAAPRFIATVTKSGYRFDA
jgi:DNA-binding response OmpR family regulator